MNEKLYLIEYNQTLSKFDLLISPVSENFTELENSLITNHLEVLENFKNIKTIEISGFQQNHFEEFSQYAPKGLISLQIFKCQDIRDFTPLEKFTNIEFLDFYWNRKATKLWDLSFNPKLIKLQMVDCNKITDFSSLKDSSIKELRLMGCNGLSSFTSNLVIDDLDNIFHMKNLESLSLDIVKNYDVKLFLKSLSKLRNLKNLYLPDNSLTFEQFAWLKAKLPNTNGLEGVSFFSFSGEYNNEKVVVENYSIIGKRKPKFLSSNKIDRIKKYEEEYKKLVEKYINESEPPE